MDDSFIDLLSAWIIQINNLGKKRPSTTHPTIYLVILVASLLIGIRHQLLSEVNLQSGNYTATTSENRFDNRFETGYHFRITEIELNGCYSSGQGGFLTIFKLNSSVCSIEIGYEINTKTGKGLFYFDPNAPNTPNEHSKTSDETVNKFLEKFYANKIRIEKINVQKEGCSIEAEWYLDAYNKGKISFSKSLNR